MADTAVLGLRPVSALDNELRAASRAVRAVAYWAPLGVILAVQAPLTARLIPSAMASPDEARYIYAGHQLIYELFHGGGSPWYDTYFSGAPAVYCPLAAIADHLGGLAAVRLMSTVLMMGVTLMLWGTTRRLFGYGASCSAAALFAGLGLAHDIGAYANYDALALLGLSASAYCAVRAGEPDARSVTAGRPDDEVHQPDDDRTPGRWEFDQRAGRGGVSVRFLLGAVALLAFANATKYMTVIFDPVVIALGALSRDTAGTVLPGTAWRRALKRMTALGLAVATLDGVLLWLAGSGYARGVLWSTLDRKAGTQAVLAATATPAHTIITESAQWVGVPVALAGIGALIAIRPWTTRCARGTATARAALLAVLCLAGVLVTLEALHLRSDESMRQHDAFGAWFSCIAAGWTVSRLAARTAGKSIARHLAIAGLTGGVILAAWQSTGHDRATYMGGITRHQTVLPYYAMMRPYLERRGLRWLIDGETDFHMAYLDGAGIPWWDLDDNNYIKWPIPGRGGDAHGQRPGRTCLSPLPGCVYLTGPRAYSSAIRAHWFAGISLFNDLYGQKAKDAAIITAARATPGYVQIAGAASSPTFVYLPDFPARDLGERRGHRQAGMFHGVRRPGALRILGGLAVAIVPSLWYAGAAVVLVLAGRRLRSRGKHASGLD